MTKSHPLTLFEIIEQFLLLDKKPKKPKKTKIQIDTDREIADL